MLKINDSKEIESSDIFSENSTFNIGEQRFDDVKSSSLRMIRLEDENSQLKKDIFKYKLDLNKKIEIYESKLIKFKELNSKNKKYQQEIFDLKKRIEISIQQNAEQKTQYSNEVQKLRNEFENQIFGLNDKNENLQKKIDKYQQLIQSKDLEKSKLDQELRTQSSKITTLLQSASNYFNNMFFSIDSFISFFTSNKNVTNESKETLKYERKKRKSLEKLILFLNQEKSKFSEQIQNLTNQNKILQDEINLFKTKQEMELNKIKMDQIISNIKSENKFSEQHQKHITKVTDQFNIIEINEKDEEIHNLHTIIFTLKKSLCKLQKRNLHLKQNLKLRETEINSLQLIQSKIENNKTNSKVKINKLKRKIIDLYTIIENLRSEIIILKSDNREKSSSSIRPDMLSNSKTYSYSNSNLNTYSNSFNYDNQSSNETVLDPSYCIDELVPHEVANSLKEIIENKGLKINVKIRLITKTLSSYFIDLMKNKSDFPNNLNYNEENIVKSFIEKVYDLILKQFINYQSFIDNKAIRKALLERAKELVSIAETQSAINSNQEEKADKKGSQKVNLINTKSSKLNSDVTKSSLSNLNSNSNIKKSSKLNSVSCSQSSKNASNQGNGIDHNASGLFTSNVKKRSKLNSVSCSQSSKNASNQGNGIDHNASGLFTSNANGSHRSTMSVNEINQSKELSAKSLSSDQDTATQIESISQLDSRLQQDSLIENSKNEKFSNSIENLENNNDNDDDIQLVSKVSLFEEEEEEYFKEDNQNEIKNEKINSDDDIISGIESLVDDLKLKID